ncbi:hypothetical protein [Granulicella tundricola]|uniref:Uncharacterized protein n=1 Tax=Granulicella tundricola (strain ATCC BAA-1859 / DSM 23138 / MP5ACTX9) TaxID=1198114 RepID=E8WZC7_GRATM|nr:hypothetical protein [Granulicella tundricola]ADW68815.1 hypothetical protein AciX9_1767 [Granulicella tundricola MP5ACTX9]
MVPPKKVVNRRVHPSSIGQSERIRQNPIRQKLIVAFVAFHAFALFLFAIPFDIAPARAARELIAPYMRCVGLTDTWDMFAPNPKSMEQYLRAVVVTRSGQYKLYSFPRMEEFSLSQRYSKERYRKFSESVLCADCSGLWPDIAKAVARRYLNPADPPQSVLLVKYESPIDPQTGTTGADAAAKSVVLAQLPIKPEDLK